MTQDEGADDGAYDLTPPPTPPPKEGAGSGGFAEAASAGGEPGARALKPGEPGWVEPTVVVEEADSADEEVPADPDVEKHKGVAVLGYVFFLIPLIVAPNSPYARFHANQGLLTFIAWCVAVVGNLVVYGLQIIVAMVFGKMVLAYFFTCILYVLQPVMLLGALALTVYGIIQAANGLKKPLPMIGQWTFIK